MITKAPPLKATNDHGEFLVVIHRCVHCDTPYDIRKATAVLRYTYCGSWCENSDLGFSLEEWTR